MAYSREAKQRVESLVKTLAAIAERDPEQEVQGIALPVLDAVLEAIKDQIGRDNPVVASVAGIISPEMIELGEPIRAVDALLVARALDGEIGSPPPPIPLAVTADPEDRWPDRF